MSSAQQASWPTVTWQGQVAIYFFIAIAVGWLIIGIPTLIGVGWSNTSSKADTSSLSLLRTQTQNGFAQQNNAVQNNLVAANQLPPGTVNVGGLNGVATALPLSGDVTLSPNGQVQINQGAVTNSQLANPAQYIVSAFPKDLPVVPSWRNSMSGPFDTGGLLEFFPFHTTAWAVSIIVRIPASATAVPNTSPECVLMRLGDAYYVGFEPNGELYMRTVTPGPETIRVPSTPLIANRAVWTTVTFSQQNTPTGWLYSLFIDNLLVGTAMVASPLYSSPTDDNPWFFNQNVPTALECAGVYIYLQPDPLEAPITPVDLQRLVVLGPGNTYSSKLNSAALAAYEFFNTPGFPAVTTTRLVQSYAPNTYFLVDQVGLPALDYTLYRNQSLAMLNPKRVSSVLLDFVMPSNVASVTVTILVEVIIPYNTTPPATIEIALVLYGATVSDGSFTQTLTVDTLLPEQTFVVEGIPTTSNTEIAQKWTAEITRDDYNVDPSNPVWVGIENLVVQGIVP